MTETYSVYRITDTKQNYSIRKKIVDFDCIV